MPPRLQGLLDRYPEPVTIYGSKPAILKMAAPGVIAVVPVLWIGWHLWQRRGFDPPPVDVLLFVGLPIGLAAFAVAMTLAKGLPKMTLTTQGFVFQALLGTRRGRWDEVSEFQPRRVAVEFSGAQRSAGIWGKLVLCGTHGRRLPVVLLDIDANGLAQLMTAWRARALEEQRKRIFSGA